MYVALLCFLSMLHNLGFLYSFTDFSSCLSLSVRLAKYFFFLSSFFLRATSPLRALESIHLNYFSQQFCPAIEQEGLVGKKKALKSNTINYRMQQN